MRSRNPVHRYSVRSEEGPYVGGSSVHDLNTVDAPHGEIDGIGGADTEDSLNNDDAAANSEDCPRESYRNSMTLHGVGVDEERSDLDNSGGSARSPCNILTINDVIHIESARARFLQIFVDHFISKHVIEVVDSADVEYGHRQDKMNKRTTKEGRIHYEGDPNYVLPLMFVANLYETLVNNVNARLASLEGACGKTIGVALEAAGGLYRKLATKFPRKGNCSFKRRELATSLETRTRFPELIVQEEKRVRFVVVNGLAIVERPETMTIEDADWFKRLTGRNEISVSARDYKFYAPRHKYRRVVSSPLSSIPSQPGYTCSDGSSSVGVCSVFLPVNEQPITKQHIQSLAHQTPFSSVQHAHYQSTHQSENTFANMHQCPHMSNLSEVPDMHQPSAIPQSVTCLQSLSAGHIGGHLHLSPTSPAKYCDECGTPYIRETSKYCSECGVKRLGI